MKMALLIILGLAVLSVAAMLYVRLAPVDQDAWHVNVFETPTRTYGAARRDIHDPREAVALLTIAQDVALQTPRTKVIAGSSEEGHITFETRSKIFGYPDYTTFSTRPHSAGGTELAAYGRARFGRSDLGVNERRLLAWMTAIMASDT